jgi:hypothetical protein
MVLQIKTEDMITTTMAQAKNMKVRLNTQFFRAAAAAAAAVGAGSPVVSRVEVVTPDQFASLSYRQ